MGKKLLIVESPHKAKVIGEFLGSDYIVRATGGHFREMPLPKDMTKLQKEKYGQYAQDIDNGFEALYKIAPGKSKLVAELKKLASTCEYIVLATDSDSEGAAISWHVLEVLKPKIPTYRATWNEITESAVRKGLADKKLINTAKREPKEFWGQAESALARSKWDRLFGFGASPLSWRLKQGTSAGRVQTPGTRLVVEREERRLAFKSVPYYSIFGEFEGLTAKLYAYMGEKIADSVNIDDEGNIADGYLLITDENLNEILGALEAKDYVIGKVSSRPYKRSPAPPFTTSSALQSIGSKTRIPSKQLTSIFQNLYQNSLVTYIRTVSVEASPEAIEAARKELKKTYPHLLPAKARVHRDKKQGNSGHECIRNVLDEKTGRLVNPSISDPKERRVFELIRLRFLASQAIDCEGTTWAAEISSTDGEARFRASETEISEPGWTAIYQLDDEVGA